MQKAGAEVGLDVAIDPVENPRVELEEHYYHPVHTKLLDLGLKPHLLNETLIETIFSTIEHYQGRVITDHILPRDRWRAGRGRPDVLGTHVRAPVPRRHRGAGVRALRRARARTASHQPAEPDHRDRPRGDVILLAIWPSVFDLVFTTFNFQAGNDRRLIFVLMVAVLVILFSCSCASSRPRT